MSRSQGLDSFRRAEYFRAQAGKVSSARRTTLHNVVMASRGKPYRLPEAQMKMLLSVADKKCFRCHGSGVQKWKMEGAMAEVCVCVQRKAPELNAALEAQKAQLEAQLAAERGNVMEMGEMQGGAVGFVSGTDVPKELVEEVKRGEASEEHRPPAVADPPVR